MPYPPPPTELCGSEINGKFLVCNDPRREVPDYARELVKGDVCVNPNDYEVLQKYVITLREKIAELKAKGKTSGR